MSNNHQNGNRGQNGQFGSQPKAGNQANAATDERLVRSAAPDVRGERGVSEDAERTNSVTGLSDAELDELVASEFEQVALPEAPMIPGYHLCWLTTMSKYDTMHKRARLGYVPVKQSEVPNFNVDTGSLSTDGGNVMCNEMILCKIPEDRYQAIMRYFHHRRPMEEEEAIIAKNKAQSGTDSKGRQLLETEGDGLEEMEAQLAAARKTRPIFS